MNRFIVACCVFSYITGAYTIALIETKRDVKKANEEKRQCVVKMSRNNQTHVFIGEYK
jgi:hypothetical protein